MKFWLCLGIFWAASGVACAQLTAPTKDELTRLLRHPAIQSGHVGISVQNARSGRILFESQALKRFVPASNMKLLTAGFALHQLGADFRFRTQVLASKVEFLAQSYWPRSVPTPFLVTLVGGNDPSLSIEDIRKMARDTAQALPFTGEKTVILRAQNGVRGDSLNGETGGARYPDGWTLDDTNWYYGAPVMGLSVERNHVDVTLRAGAKIGEAASVQVVPEAPFAVQNLVITGAAGGDMTFERGQNEAAVGENLTLGGTIEVGQTRTEGIAVLNPREWARQIFQAELQAAGVAVVDPQVPFAPTEQQLLLFHDSAPLGELLQRFLKSSDNLYGELILRRAGAGAQKPGAPSKALVVSTGAARVAHQKMANWLALNKIDGAGLRFSDGSGLSRYNLLTPRAVADFLRLMKDSSPFYNALPVAGVDGTLRNQMKNSAAQGNARAKTGTFSIVNCLSGYVTTQSGERLVVSILTNGVEDGTLARRWQGRVFATLAAAP